MKISEWISKNFTHVTFEDTIGTLKVPKVNIDLTYGLLSTENKEEFQKLVFHLAPVGIIVDDIPTEFYEGKMLLLRNMLTKMLMEEPNHKMAERFLNILERRDRSHWGKESKMTAAVSDKDGKTVSLTYQVI